ncbi:MAG: carbohydrate-binding protein [Pseudomonadota bacterium]
MKTITLKQMLAIFVWLSIACCTLSVGIAKAATVDLLVLYDTHSKNYFSGDPNTAMINWVNQMNAAYSASQVDIQLRLVGVIQHEQGGADQKSVLNNLSVDTTAIALRDQLGADFVSQLHKTGECGVGFIAVHKDYAWNVTSPGCGPMTMVHELGHNMGLDHSRRQGNTTGTRYGYGLGYGVDSLFVDIMAYNSSFNNAPTLNLFSNPNLLCKGVPCGVPEGQPQEAYAAKALNNVRDEIAGFRTQNNGTGALIQAENSSDRSGTKVELTNDTDGGSNVGWINTGNWLVYPVNIPTAGNYIVSYRVASLNGGGVIQLEKAGGNPVYGTVNVPSTGGWQTWVTITQVVKDLPAGIQNIGLVAKSGGFNLNWFKIDPAGGGGGNKLSNSDFNNGMANWTVNSGNGAGATSGVQGGSAYVWITTGGTNVWDIQLSQNTTITQGKRYKVDLDARITEGSTRTLSVNIEKNIAPWTNYGTTTFALGTSWKHYTYTYDAVTASDAQARLVFQLGVNTSDVNVDNITFTEL